MQLTKTTTAVSPRIREVDSNRTLQRCLREWKQAIEVKCYSNWTHRHFSIHYFLFDYRQGRLKRWLPRIFFNIVICKSIPIPIVMVLPCNPMRNKTILQMEILNVSLIIEVMRVFVKYGHCSHLTPGHVILLGSKFPRFYEVGILRRLRHSLNTRCLLYTRDLSTLVWRMYGESKLIQLS